MKKVTVSLSENIGYGTLMWIYANNQKVYHTNKRVDRVETFDEVDTNYLGTVKEIGMNKTDRKTILDLIKNETDRVFGVCIDKESKQNGNGTKNFNVQFFSNWEEVMTFAKTSFQDLAQTEVQRKKEAKEQWLERGRLFAQRKVAKRDKVEK